MNKTILVIGAGRGLGFGVAKKFASEGYRVILVARNVETLRSMCDDLKGIGAEAYYRAADTSDESAYGQALEEIKAEFGAPDVVVYNTGITTPDTPTLSASDLIAHFKTDVVGAFVTAQKIIDGEFMAKKGALIFTGGGLALYPADGFVPLSIDKSALRTLAYILHSRYADRGVYVGTVTVCGTIGANAYFSADNIAELYWEMNEKRGKCEYAYEFPRVSPLRLYAGEKVEYGIFEENSERYWGEVYSLMSER